MVEAGATIFTASPHLEKVVVLWLLEVVTVSSKGSVVFPVEKIMSVVAFGADVEAFFVHVS